MQAVSDAILMRQHVGVVTGMAKSLVAPYDVMSGRAGIASRLFKKVQTERTGCAPSHGPASLRDSRDLLSVTAD